MSLTDALLLDPYPVHKWLAVRSDGIAGTGTLNDPLNANTPERFDSLMTSFEPGTTIHLLGAGPFQTRGYYDGGAFSGYGWQAKGQTRIVGSGVAVTTLRLVINAGAPANAHFYAIGHPFTTGLTGGANLTDFLEISDLTIDCNCAGQATGITQARCGAIRAMGNHLRIKRVKAINWGSMVSDKTCFVIALVTADPDSGVSGVNNAGMEDCVVVQPATSGPVAALHVGPKEDLAPTSEAYGKVPFIRNCFVDFGTLNASLAHRALSMGWCLGGLLEGNQVYNVKHGGLFLQQGSIRDLAVRNNFFKNVYKGLFFQPSLASSPFSGSVSPTATVTCSGHNLVVGDRVEITHQTGQATAFDGIHEVTSTADANHFTFDTSASVGSSVNVTLAKVHGSGKILIEGNEIELAPEVSHTLIGQLIGVHLDDAGLVEDSVYPAYVHGEAVLRDNRMRYVDGQVNGSEIGFGLQADGVGRLTVQDQVLELTPDILLSNSHCGAVTYFNNKTPGGDLVQGVNADLNNKKYDELATQAEDAFVLAFMNRK